HRHHTFKRAGDPPPRELLLPRSTAVLAPVQSLSPMAVEPRACERHIAAERWPPKCRGRDSRTLIPDNSGCHARLEVHFDRPSFRLRDFRDQVSNWAWVRVDQPLG